MLKKELSDLLAVNNGVLKLTPTWVPRSFCRPGRRIKLHPDDYYALGASRGGIDERWLSSTTHADNGASTPQDEGLSYIAVDEVNKVLLSDTVEILGAELIGDTLWDKYHGWSMFSKFFDNLGPLPHHIHHRDAHAARVGAKGKPEMYFFPSQLNNHGGEFNVTFFGLNPDVTREQVRMSLENFTKVDNRILDLSRAYTLPLDTGWDVPPGLLHAPASLCTYEPQFASDVYAMYQSVLHGGQCVPEELLWKDCPAEEKGNYEYLLDVIDWELNTDPDIHKKRFMLPIPVSTPEKMTAEGYYDEWICYRCKTVSAKRLTVFPGKKITVKDGAAYGMIAIQGSGVIEGHKIETPTVIRYGEMTDDEFFVSHSAAVKGVTIENTSQSENLVILRHFSDNPDLPLNL